MNTKDARNMLETVRHGLIARLCRLSISNGELVEEPDVFELALGDADRIGCLLPLAVGVRGCKPYLSADTLHDPDDQAIPQGSPETFDDDWLTQLAVEHLLGLVEAAEAAVARIRT